MRTLATNVRNTTGIATAALVGLSAQALRSADDIAKSARNANLSVEAYQRLSHAFTLAGSSGDALTKASQTLARQISELGQGTSTQVDAFNRLGLSFEDLGRLTPEQQLLTVLDALRNVGDVTERTALSQELLGRAGKELGTIMQTTNAEILAQGQRLQDLGGILSEDATKSAEAFNDELEILSTVLQTQFTQGFLDSIGATQDWSEAIRTSGQAANELGRVLPRVATFLIENRDAVLLAAGAWVSFKAIALTGAVVGTITALVKAVRSLATVMAAFAATSLAAVTIPAILTAAFLALGTAIGLAAGALTNFLSGDAESFSEGWEQAIDNVKAFFVDLKDTASDFAVGAFEDVADNLRTTVADALGLGIQEGADRGLINLGRVVADEYARVLAGTTAQAPNILRGSAAIQDFGPTGDIGLLPSGPSGPPGEIETRVRDLGEDAVEGFREGLRNAFRTGDFGGIARTITDRIQEGLAGRAADRIADSVSDLFTSVFDAVLPQISAGGGAGGIGGFISSLFGGGFQQGGIIPGQRNAPRLILAHAGELVLNERQQRGVANSLSGGAQTVLQPQVNVSVTNTQPDTTRVQTESRTGRDGQVFVNLAVLSALENMTDSGEVDSSFGAFGGRRQLIQRG